MSFLDKCASRQHLTFIVDPPNSALYGVSLAQRTLRTRCSPSMLHQAYIYKLRDILHPRPRHTLPLQSTRHTTSPAYAIHSTSNLQIKLPATVCISTTEPAYTTEVTVYRRAPFAPDAPYLYPVKHIPMLHDILHLRAALHTTHPTFPTYAAHYISKLCDTLHLRTTRQTTCHRMHNCYRTTLHNKSYSPRSVSTSHSTTATTWLPAYKTRPAIISLSTAASPVYTPSPRRPSKLPSLLYSRIILLTLFITALLFFPTSVWPLLRSFLLGIPRVAPVWLLFSSVGRAKFPFCLRTPPPPSSRDIAYGSFPSYPIPSHPIPQSTMFIVLSSYLYSYVSIAS